VTFELGDPVRIEMEKWGGLRHWHIPGRWLGHDEQGDWVGFPIGSEFDRPGAHSVTSNHQVGLVPHPDLAPEHRWWLGTFHGPGGRLGVDVYVDIATPPVWDGNVLRTVDLDLDVVKNDDGSVWVDDEDEFTEHQVSLGYPPEVVETAELSCARVLAAVKDRHAPYDGSHEPWLAVLRDLTSRR
jgi:hypothetical protein